MLGRVKQVNHQITKLSDDRDVLSHGAHIIGMRLIVAADVATAEVHAPGVVRIAVVGSRRPVIGGHSIGKIVLIDSRQISPTIHNR